MTFFELPTGHWPMLSDPDALAVTLLRAAAGEGHRLTPAGAVQPEPFLLDVPELPRERTGTIDLYLPPSAGGPAPLCSSCTAARCPPTPARPRGTGRC